jgi:membrane protein YqaA with SNARE-associated domain
LTETLTAFLSSLQAWFTADASLWSLFFGSFLAATLVPIGSEVMLLAVLALHPALAWPAVLVATVGNTCGALTSYGIGRLVTKRVPEKHEAWLKRYGVPALLLSWMPFVGDALCVATGWLRLPLLPSVVAMAVGRGLRYVVVTLVWMWA